MEIFLDKKYIYKYIYTNLPSLFVCCEIKVIYLICVLLFDSRTVRTGLRERLFKILRYVFNDNCDKCSFTSLGISLLQVLFDIVSSKLLWLQINFLKCDFINSTIEVSLYSLNQIIIKKNIMFEMQEP